MRHKAYPLLAVVLASMLAFPQHGWGQQAGLQVLVLSGEAATNDVETRAASEPVVEVRNSQGEPVPGAKVVFRTPAVGPSATFYGASRAITMTTDETGRATAGGMMPNTEPGEFFIDVTATSGSLKGGATIAQSNVHDAHRREEQAIRLAVLGRHGRGRGTRHRRRRPEKQRPLRSPTRRKFVGLGRLEPRPVWPVGVGAVSSLNRQGLAVRRMRRRSVTQSRKRELALRYG